MDDLDAGDFSSWLASMGRALRGGGDAAVPCDGCTACCRSSQFVHIAPDENDTLAHIPAELLVPAPRMPPGHVVMGYDERGRCPMLVDDGCSIYAHRPRTCRSYDCRVFPAAGVELDEPEKVAITERARRWRFRHPTPRDREQHDAVRATALALRRRPDRLPEGVSPTNVTRIAVLAVEVISERA
jgi:Fe-S-cluster containining protein